MTKGSVFDITPYMTEDGPGIRTVVFMKGCPLRCKWCSNVYGLEAGKQLIFIADRCIGCMACTKSCKHGGYVIDQYGKPAINGMRCINCGECAKVCKTGAKNLIGKEIEVSELLSTLEQYRMFYRRGSGGITVSGGELLLQGDFVKELLEECKKCGISTAIESSAYGAWDLLKMLLVSTDFAFLDLKHMNCIKHKELTGVGNQLILKNIELAAAFALIMKNTLIVRMPLIPDYNDAEENIRNTARFVNALPGNIELNVLPYHNFGKKKYEYLGKEYELSDVLAQDKKRLNEVKAILTDEHAFFSIGGGNVRSY